MQLKLGVIVINLLGLALLIYTGTRTVDFIALTLPPQQQALAFIGLAAFDGGLLGWLLFYLRGARGQWQRAIALLMIVVSLIGVVTAFVGDTLYRAAERGVTAGADPALTLTVIYGMAAVIAANIAALVAVHLVDPDAQRAQAERDARDQIEAATTAQISQRSATLAASLAPEIAGQWAEDITTRYRPALTPVVRIEPPPDLTELPSVPTPAIMATPAPNSHAPDPKLNGRSNGAAPTP